jgi:hypothetical protein
MVSPLRASRFLIAQFRKRSAISLVVGPPATQASTSLCCRSSSVTPRSCSQLTKFDGYRDSLLAAQEGAVWHGLHLVHAAQVLPADVPLDDVAVGFVGEARECFGRPLLVADSQLVTPGEDAVVDQEPADLVACS